MSQTHDPIPNPGSDEAFERGCICPNESNAFGRGAWGTDGELFWRNELCPLHGTKETMNTNEQQRKPLGRKSYGHIPHLPGSRMGPADKTCHEGQYRICRERARDKHDRIIVQEKLDGSNVGVAKIAGAIVALTRAGYEATTSPYEQHHRFAEWVSARTSMFDQLLTDGERVCGEWLAQAHGTRYDLRHDPFVAFDIMRDTTRALWHDVTERCGAVGLARPFVLHCGDGVGASLSIADAMEQLGTFGHHGARDPVEGAVWRVERNGKVDYLAKYVRPDKIDGCFLPEITGNHAEWNWLP